MIDESVVRRLAIQCGLILKTTNLELCPSYLTKLEAFANAVIEDYKAGLVPEANSELYKNPTEAGRNAFKNGKNIFETPIDSRTHANASCLWDLGYLAELTKCKGIEIEAGVFSGCSGDIDCPICFGAAVSEAVYKAMLKNAPDKE